MPQATAPLTKLEQDIRGLAETQPAIAALAQHTRGNFTELGGSGTATAATVILELGLLLPEGSPEIPAALLKERIECMTDRNDPSAFKRELIALYHYFGDVIEVFREYLENAGVSLDDRDWLYRRLAAITGALRIARRRARGHKPGSDFRLVPT